MSLGFRFLGLRVEGFNTWVFRVCLNTCPETVSGLVLKAMLMFCTILKPHQRPKIQSGNNLLRDQDFTINGGLHRIVLLSDVEVSYLDENGPFKPLGWVIFRYSDCQSRSLMKGPLQLLLPIGSNYFKGDDPTPNLQP